MRKEFEHEREGCTPRVERSEERRVEKRQIGLAI
jgi:hypothetical protein